MAFPLALQKQLQWYINRWQLIEEGEAFQTPTSYLQPVRFQNIPAMLKIATIDEERRGNQLMVWWRGDGAAQVLAYDAHAVLLERATGTRSLVAMVESGSDCAASQIVCAVAKRLHAARPNIPKNLIPLPEWFNALTTQNALQHKVLQRAASVARRLLATQHDITVLHGDLHHQNILDFGARGWLAIDPKGLVGERAFDFANIFCNPSHEISINNNRLQEQLKVISISAKLDSVRLLAWVAAWSGLSAVWDLDEGKHPDTALAVAEIALNELYKLNYINN